MDLATSSEPPQMSGFGRFYSLYHDGWYGSLELWHESGQFLHGRYVDIRWDRAYSVTAAADSSYSNRIELTIHQFNQLPKQVFQGFLGGPGRDAFAGTTWWHDQPFGFFARRGGFLHLTDYGDGTERVTPSDFIGSYTVWHEEGLGTLKFTAAAGDRLLGQYTEPQGQLQDLVARVGSSCAHEISLSVPIGREFASFTGYLFTRPKNAIAGGVERHGKEVGMFMTKFRSGDSSVRGAQ